MKNYNYEKWLAAHATSKSMMEKLERSLIPYELFALIPLNPGAESLRGTVEHCGNLYDYTVAYACERIGHRVFDAVITAREVHDAWLNPLLGYNRFKVVMKDADILTIYSAGEQYFSEVIEMFEGGDESALYERRSAYVNNLLARYILLRLLEKHYPGMQLLAPVHTRGGVVTAMGANANRSELFMYAFDKSRALEMARHYDGLARSLTVVYFINRDFERDGNDEEFDTGRTSVLSIRQFYNALPVTDAEKRQLEQRVLLLVSLLYDEPLCRDRNRIERVALNPPTVEELRHRKKKKVKGKNGKSTAAKGHLPENVWYHHIYRTLLEDALNVLHDTPRTRLDIFHFLCASTMVNAYVNFCNRRNICSQRQVSRMFRAKQEIAATLLRLASERNPEVAISTGEGGAVFAEISVSGRLYQFSYRGIDRESLMRLAALRLRTGRYRGYSMQSIATALYQYSLLLRQEGL